MARNTAVCVPLAKKASASWPTEKLYPRPTRHFSPSVCDCEAVETKLGEAGCSLVTRPVLVIALCATMDNNGENVSQPGYSSQYLECWAAAIVP